MDGLVGYGFQGDYIHAGMLAHTSTSEVDPLVSSFHVHFVDVGIPLVGVLESHTTLIGGSPKSHVIDFTSYSTSYVTLLGSCSNQTFMAHSCFMYK